jgi:hypothetical protein
MQRAFQLLRPPVLSLVTVNEKKKKSLDLYSFHAALLSLWCRSTKREIKRNSILVHFIGQEVEERKKKPDQDSDIAPEGLEIVKASFCVLHNNSCFVPIRSSSIQLHKWLLRRLQRENILSTQLDALIGAFLYLHPRPRYNISLFLSHIISKERRNYLPHPHYAKARSEIVSFSFLIALSRVNVFAYNFIHLAPSRYSSNR